MACGARRTASCVVMSCKHGIQQDGASDCESAGVTSTYAAVAHAADGHMRRTRPSHRGAWAVRWRRGQHVLHAFRPSDDASYLVVVAVVSAGAVAGSIRACVTLSAAVCVVRLESRAAPVYIVQHARCLDEAATAYRTSLSRVPRAPSRQRSDAPPAPAFSLLLKVVSCSGALPLGLALGLGPLRLRLFLLAPRGGEAGRPRTVTPDSPTPSSEQGPL